MAFDPNTTPFLMPMNYTNPSFGVQNSVVLQTSGDISADFTGGGGSMTLLMIGNLAAVQNIVSNGLVAITDWGDTATTRQIVSSGSIAVTNPAGIAGDISVDVVNNTSVQRIEHAYNSTFPATLSGTTINWVPGTGIGVTLGATAGHSESIDVQITGSFLPSNISAVLTSATVGHSFNLGGLASGLLKIGVSGSIATPAIAVAGTDYLVPTTTLNQIGALTEADGALITGSAGNWVRLDPGAVGNILTVISPNTLGYAPSASGSNATYICQTGAGLPTFGVNLGATNASLGIGLTTPASALDILTTNFSTSGTIHVVADHSSVNMSSLYKFTNYGGTSVSHNQFDFLASRGSIGTPTAIQSGDSLAEMRFLGYNGTAFVDSAHIIANATQAYSVGNAGSSLNFYTTPNGSVTSAQALLIDQSSQITMANGTSATTTTALPHAYQLNINSLFPLALYADGGNTLAGMFSSGNFKTALNLHSCGGTLASPTATTNGTMVGQVGFSGYDTTNYFVGSEIQSTTTQTWTASAHGSNVTVLTTPNNSIIPTLAATFGQDQSLTVAGNLIVGGSIIGEITASVVSGESFSGISTNSTTVYGGYKSTVYGGFNHIVFDTAGGTSVSPTAVTTADILGAFSISGYDGTAFTTPYNAITVIPTETWHNTPNQNGFSTNFYTVKSGTAVPTLRMLIDHNGSITLGGGGTTSYNLGGLTWTPNVVATGTNADVGMTILSKYAGSCDSFLDVLSYQASSRVFLGCANGVYGSTTHTTSGQGLGGFQLGGSDGTTFVAAAQVAAVATQDYASGQTGTAIYLQSTPNNTNIGVTGIFLDQGGQTTIGNVSTTPTAIGSGAAKLTVYNTNASTDSAHFIHTTGQSIGYYAGFGNTTTTLTLQSAGGSYGSQTASATTTNIGKIGFAGALSSSVNYTGASITAETTQAWGASAAGTSLTVAVTPNSTITPATAMFIDQTSQVTLGDVTATPPSNSGSVESSTLYALSTTGNTITALGTLGAGQFNAISYGAVSAMQILSCGGTYISPAVLGNGSSLGAINFGGFYGSSYGFGATITATATQNFSLNNYGSQLALGTAPNSSGTVAATMTLSGGGSTSAYVGIGTTTKTASSQLQLPSNNAYLASATVWISAASDARVKQNITDVHDDAISVFSQLQPRKFQFTPEHLAYQKTMYTYAEGETPPAVTQEELDEIHYGFIAQELETVLPECIIETGNSSGVHDDIKTYSMHPIHVLAFKAIKELIDKVTTLEAQVAALSPTVPTVPAVPTVS